eukprot:gene8133-781_t
MSKPKNGRTWCSGINSSQSTNTIRKRDQNKDIPLAIWREYFARSPMIEAYFIDITRNFNGAILITIFGNHEVPEISLRFVGMFEDSRGGFSSPRIQEVEIVVTIQAMSNETVET